MTHKVKYHSNNAKKLCIFCLTLYFLYLLADRDRKDCYVIVITWLNTLGHFRARHRHCRGVKAWFRLICRWSRCPTSPKSRPMLSGVNLYRRLHSSASMSSISLSFLKNCRGRLAFGRCLSAISSEFWISHLNNLKQSYPTFYPIGYLFR